MAQRMPRIFTNSSESSTATYNYTDIASGEGKVVFYIAEVGSTPTKLLTTEVIASDKVMQLYTTTPAPASDTIVLDVDYDVLFNKPQTLKGTAIFNIAAGFQSSVATTSREYVKCYVRKWNGTTETEIANGTSETFLKTTAASETHNTILTAAATIPVTNIKKGEYLRITIELHGWAGDNQNVYYFGQDPKDRAASLSQDPYTFGTDTSISKAIIPFRIDL